MTDLHSALSMLDMLKWRSDRQNYHVGATEAHQDGISVMAH